MVQEPCAIPACEGHHVQGDCCETEYFILIVGTLETELNLFFGLMQIFDGVLTMIPLHCYVL